MQEGLSLSEYSEWLAELNDQPAWRTNADKEADYFDGNQLDSDAMRRATELGLPPAIEPLIGPTIESVLGLEAKTRKDWKVLPEGNEDDDVAEAIGYKLSQAERKSKADMACAEAFASQVKVGIGWVEVSRETDPFKYPYRVTPIHRNEIWWDWAAKEDDLSDARYLIRRKWTDLKIAKLMFPESSDLIERAGSGNWGDMLMYDGSTSTGLYNAWSNERGWSIEEMEWRDLAKRRACINEVWYRVWDRVLVLRTPDGRVVEYDQNNQAHLMALSVGATAERVVLSKARVSYWLGPHKLHDSPTPYTHNNFPYVPFWGNREDRTRVPYGLIRGMIYLQDEVNARIAKMQWGLGSAMTIRTEGAVLDDDDTFRGEVGRVDADIVLDADHMARPGARFEIKRDFQLNAAQFERLSDAREGIKRAGGIYNAFIGQDGGMNQTGVALSTLTEQSAQTLAKKYDNFQESRKLVGSMLMSLVIEDMAGKEETVTIEGDIFNQPKQIVLNKLTVDQNTGIEYRDNDVERVKLKVDLTEVPSTPTFRTQQVQSIAEVIKSAPPEFMKVLVPRMISLMDVPDKNGVIEELRKMGEQPNPELQIKEREVAVKEAMADANIKKIIADAVQSSVTAMFSATQAGMQIASMPGIAPVADQILNSAGMKDADMPPLVASPSVTLPPQPVGSNTSPAFPPRPQSPEVGVTSGIEA